MGRPLKIIALLIGAFVALLVVAAIMFALVFDPNDYKDKISAGVKEATGRDLVIEGDLQLSLFPWLAIEVGRTELGNAPGFDDTPFASFDSARLSVEVLPVLLRREIVVATAALDGMNINLQVRKDGVGNWEDLAEAGEAEADEVGPGDGAATGTIDVAGIAVTNAALTYADAATGSRIELQDLNFTTGGIASVDESVIGIDGIDIGANIIGVVDVPASIQISLPGISVDTEAQSADIGEIDVQFMSVNLQADVEPFSYAGDPQPTAMLSIAAFSPRTLMTELGIEAPETADPDVLDKLFAEANAVVGADAISLSGLELVIDDTTFTGGLSVPRAPDGVFEVDLAGDSIDIARYMAPASEAGTGEAGAAEAVEIPVDMIRAFNVRGNFSIATVNLGELLFENVTLGVNSKDGQLRMHPIAADFFDGGYRGDIRINAAGDVPSISVNEKISDVNLAAMARAVFEVENITGMINGTFNLGGRGADMNAIRRDLDGNMSLELLDGAWEGVDVWHEIRKARALIKGEPAPEAPATPRTQFSSMTATGAVSNGVMQNDDFFAELPFMQVTGRGSVNFVEATVDYAVRGRVLEKPEFMTDVSQEELDDFTSAVIPFTITGPLADPSIRPDIEALLKEQVEEEAKQLIIDKLLGGEEEPPAEGEEPAQEEQQPEEEKDIEDQLKDEAKKRLKDLLGG
jgi:AsmA protein